MLETDERRSFPVGNGNLFCVRPRRVFAIFPALTASALAPPLSGEKPFPTLDHRAATNLEISAPLPNITTGRESKGRPLSTKNREGGPLKRKKVRKTSRAFFSQGKDFGFYRKGDCSRTHIRTNVTYARAGAAFQLRADAPLRDRYRTSGRDLFSSEISGQGFTSLPSVPAP